MSYGGFEYNDGGYGDGGYDDTNMGGGYLNASPGSRAFGSQDNAMGTQDRKLPRERFTLTPMTVKQFNSITQDQPDDTFRLEGREIKEVKIVGRIVRITESNASVRYVIEDGTGSMEATVFASQSDGSMAEPAFKFREGNYVKVHGNVRAYNQRINLIGFSIRPVTDFNEVTCHFLECIHIHLLVTRPEKAPGSSNMMIDSVRSDFTGMMGGLRPVGESQGDSMGAEYRKILSVFAQDPNSETGINISSAAAQLQMNEGQLRKMVEFLNEEGHLYSTIDDNHFKATM